MERSVAELEVIVRDKICRVCSDRTPDGQAAILAGEAQDLVHRAEQLLRLFRADLPFRLGGRFLGLLLRGLRRVRRAGGRLLAHHEPGGKHQDGGPLQKPAKQIVNRPHLDHNF